MTDLPPGIHGFHIHETGSTDQGCAAAGAHYNPMQMSHGGPNDMIRHIGDLGNIQTPVISIIISGYWKKINYLQKEVFFLPIIALFFEIRQSLKTILKLKKIQESGPTPINVLDSTASLSGNFSIIGRSVVIHEKPDDLGKGGTEDSLKTGSAGARIACGVIGNFLNSKNAPTNIIKTFQ